MFDINEIMKRAKQANEQAVDTMKKSFEKSEEIIGRIEASSAEKDESVSLPEEEEQIDAYTQYQTEILGQLFGEDMGILSAALEMLEMEDENDEEELSFDLELEQNLYTVLEETMSRIESLPESESVSYQKDDPRWRQFGILLSGIVSNLNSHDLSGMDVEEHIPVLEQKVVSIVRRFWGIDGRSDLLDMIRYLAQEGYILKYQLYSEASLPEELMNEDMDDEDKESVNRTWRFVQRYKGQYAPGFLAGWDVGRAAMLTRWGCYLGWITEGEAVGILWDLSQKIVEELHSWREFAQSYLFGGLMWKLLCGDSSAESYLGYIADAATDLLVGKPEEDGGQWGSCPWPLQRKIGFTL